MCTISNTKVTLNEIKGKIWCKYLRLLIDNGRIDENSFNFKDTVNQTQRLHNNCEEE